MNFLRGAWQFLTAPRFVADIERDYEKLFVTAGEKTKIATISISLEKLGQLERSEYVRPLSDYVQDDRAYVTCENERWVDEKLVLDMFVYITVTGNYCIIPKFPTDSYVRLNGLLKIPLQVKPSNTCYILLKKYVNSHPITDDECVTRDVASYRGDTVKVYVDVTDEFQNRYLEDDLDFRIDSDVKFVMVVQPATRDRGTGWYVITVRYQKVGVATMELSLQEDSHLNATALSQKVKVITPPVSAANSYIIQNKVDKIQEEIFEAGQVIKFKLNLMDIIGNPISYEESKVFLENSLGLVSCKVNYVRRRRPGIGLRRYSDANQECIVPQMRPLESEDDNICEVKFTLTKAGSRQVSLLFNNMETYIANSNSAMRIKVLPRPLEELQIHKQDPIDFRNVYRGDTAKIWLKAKDEFGNRIVENNLKFAVFSDSSLVKLLSADNDDNPERGSHELTLQWDKVGKDSFELTASQGDRQIRKEIPLKVIPPPVSAAKSYIIQSDIDEIQERFHEAGQAITLKLKLIDIFGNGIFYNENKSFIESICMTLHDTSQVHVGDQDSLEIERIPSTSSDQVDSMYPNANLYSSDASEENLMIFTSKGKPTLGTKRHNSNVENAILKLRPLDVNSNICEIEFTPTIAGSRRVSLFAGSKTEEISTIRIKVHPGPVKELQIVKQNPGEFRNVYRGDTAKIWLKAEDEFGNRIVESDLKFAVFSDSSLVKLLSDDDDDDDSERRSHGLAVHWEKVGKGSFDLIASRGNNQVKKNIPLKVIPPPVSAAKSYIIQSDIDEIQERFHEAGQAITLKLKLIDVFGNAISYEEGTSFVESICLILHEQSQGQVTDQDSSEKSNQLAKEKSSFKISPSDVDSSACELTLTPYIAGKRLLSLSLHEERRDKNVGKSPLSFTVTPGPLAKVEIVSHESQVSDQSLFSSCAKQTRTVVVKGQDEYGNEVALDPRKWYLDTLGELKQEAKLITRVNGLAFQYTFDKPGTYKVDIKPKESMIKLAKVPCFEVEIVKAPLDLDKCFIACADNKPIFVGDAQTSFRIQVSLFDCIGNRYSQTASDSEFRTDLLSIKVNGERSNIATLESGTAEGEMYMSTVIDNDNVGTKDVQVTYDDKPLGEKLSIKIVGLKPYETGDFVRLYENKKEIRCKDVWRGMLADYANLDNINRLVKDKGGEILLKSDIIENKDNNQVKLINVDLKKFENETLPVFLEIISLFVEGAHYYRNQANQFNGEREKWKANSMEAYFSNKHEEAKACSGVKEKFASLMNQCHRKASDVIFEFYNRNRPQSEIDLHGQLVADPKKMREYGHQLLSKRERKSSEVDSVIERERQERDEAIRKLDERWQNFDHQKAKQDGEDWLEIIDGAGHHSARRGEQKIRPKVKEYLKKKNMKYVEANEGALLVTFSEYTGKEPCVADFYCTECKKTWTSASSWKGLFQRCFRCYRKNIYTECYPFKLRCARRQRRQWSGAESTNSNAIVINREDHRKLCEKCIMLGRDCHPRLF